MVKGKMISEIGRNLKIVFTIFFCKIYSSLRIPLVHESTEVRAATLRTIRHLTKTLEDVQSLNELHIPYLITRCLDIELDNKVERLQVLKLARHLNFVARGLDFPLMLLRSIVAIGK